MKHFFQTVLLLIVVACPVLTFAQAGIGTLSPHASAQLDIVSTTKGMLTPRMTTAQRAGISNPAEGLLVYDTDLQSFWYYKTGTGWSSVQSMPFSLPYFASENNNNHLFTIMNQGMGIPIGAVSSSIAANATAIQGILDSPTPGGLSSGVSGINRDTGYNGMGIYGEHWGRGAGIYGHSNKGLGVRGYSQSGSGVLGFSDSSYGVQALSFKGIGLYARSTDSLAIYASSNKAKPTVRIENTYAGPVGSSYTTALWVSQADSGYGVIATSDAGIALLGNADHGAGVYGSSSQQIGVAGYSYNGIGVQAESIYGIGITARSYDSTAARFVNTSSSNTASTLEVTTNGVGHPTDQTQGNAANFSVDNSSSRASAIYARSATNHLLGRAALVAELVGTGGKAAGYFNVTNANSSSYGVYAETAGNGPALYGTSDDGSGVEGHSSNSIGVQGTSIDHIGIYGSSIDSVGIFAESNTNTALQAVALLGGSAARFRINGVSNTSPVLVVEEVGASSLAVFRSGTSSFTLANVARISNTGVGYFNGGTQNSGADIAEAFDVVNEISEYEPGDVLVIAKDQDRTVEKSNESYSSLVIGVYATKPGVLLTEETIDTDISDKVPMGVVGVIPTKVCNEGGAIKRGDMLVTSSKKGVAMKADPEKAKTGQIIGKALQNFNGKGVGKINVFVNVK